MLVPVRLVEAAAAGPRWPCPVHPDLAAAAAAGGALRGRSSILFFVASPFLVLVLVLLRLGSLTLLMLEDESLSDCWAAAGTRCATLPLAAAARLGRGSGRMVFRLSRRAADTSTDWYRWKLSLLCAVRSSDSLLG